MDKLAFLALLDKYLAGNTTAEEEQWLLNYYHHYPQSEIWNEAILGARDLMEARVLHRLQTAMAKEQQAAPVVQMRIWKRVAVAAAVVLVLGMGYLNRVAISNWFDPVQLQQLTTQLGERKSITLPDGTLIWLSPGSVLEYPDKFRGDLREVSLKGEAFFEVFKDAAHPFIIHSGEVNTKVLGTSFNIQAYHEGQPMNVTVVTGKVAVELNRQSAIGNQQLVTLEPNHRAVLNRNTQTLIKEDYPDAARRLLARREGNFEYNGAAVSEIVDDLRRQFAVTITIQGNVNNCTYYGPLKATDDAAQFLQKLSFAINGRLQKAGNHYTLIAPGCEQWSIPAY